MTNSSKKFDLQGILNNIKSMISPEGSTPDVNPDDAISIKISELSLLTQQLAKTHAEQAKEFTRINRLLNDLFKDIEALRNPLETELPESSESSVTSEIKPSEEEKEKIRKT
ncbi:hypothetical protein [Candidatus Coxiella mudrowiae]|uniref:Cytosolic protein n=1 Tax=Candidatus Coxiella mudrowiae TaxID=2054173 RepID=A0ABM5UUB0_9COXI|nr:hypothetical protein [Candidatus Coxiella mudrowiae]AKQ33559.1 Uncharacterized protein CleRT_07300 [Candidatus Coxiella mudrowiae]